MTHSAAATLRARTGFALLAVAAVALSACTGVGGPTSGGTPSGEAVATPTDSAPQMSGDYVVGADGKLLKPTDGPVPIAPTPPASITEDTPEAAEDFARYFVAVAEYAWNSGDTTELRAISTADCEMCTSMADAVDRVQGAGGWTIGMRYDITEVEPPVEHPRKPNAQVLVLHVTSSSETSYDGSTLGRSQLDRELVEAHLCRVDSEWRLCGGTGADDPES